MITAVNKECVLACVWCVCVGRLGGQCVRAVDAALLMLDPADGLDLRSLTVGAPVLPVLVISTVPLTLHDVLPAPVAWELVTHKTTHTLSMNTERVSQISASMGINAC